MKYSRLREQLREHERSPRQTAHGLRQAAVLFSIVGVIGLINDLAPNGVGYGHPVSIALDSLTVAIGAATWRLSQRRAVAEQLSLILPLAAFTLVGLNNVAGVLPPAAYGTFFVLIFVWVGAWHAPRTVLAFLPFAFAAYLLPLLAGAPHSPDAIASVLLVVPGAVVAGETVAFNATSARRAGAGRERLLGELARTNVTDSLTGVGNRRLGDLLLQSLSAGDAIVLLDLDHFKRVNDTLGHPEGDRVLQEFGSYLHSSLRENDAVARMGGEEFLLVLRGANHGAHGALERLLAGWNATSPLVTASAGGAVHDRHASPERTYAAADAALYRAKSLGRNRVVMTGADRTLHLHTAAA